jgi:predicted unusual protein kinase regulating ubiquinone biosynthesis (AarF/ABC1/UbiB family)
VADARALAALRSLGETALRLGRDTTSARLALAHLHAVVDPAAVPADIRRPIVRELDAAAEAAAVPLAFKDVERILRQAWGGKPTSELDDLEREPAAVTPAAQVHRGVLGGRPVAVKVIRPGIPEVVRSDLGLADALLRPLGAAFPRIDPAALVAEARERVLDELDLEHEGSTQRAFHRALRHHPVLHVPAVHSALTHERVLVSDWVDGRPVLEATADERPAVARALVAFHVGGARFGTVHADPHPGNALLLGDGRVAFLDFGAARRVDAGRADGAVAALDALAAGDAAALGTALHGLGWLPADAGPEADRLARELLDGLLDGPARLDADALLAIGERLEAHVQAVATLAARTTVPPADLWPLRMLGGLFALCARLGVTEDWPTLVRTATRDGW